MLRVIDMKEIKFNPKYKNTLLCNFATPNLYSIILDRYGPFKRRLFVHMDNGDMGMVPLHAHKYIDEMEYLFGHVEDLCCKESATEEHAELLTEYAYARLNEEYHPLAKTGAGKFFVIDKHYVNETHKIYAHQLHTVKVKGFSAWIIHELDMNVLYEKYEGKCYSHDDLDGSEINPRKGNDEDYELLSKCLETNGFKLIEDAKYKDVESEFDFAKQLINMYHDNGIKVKGYIKRYFPGN